MVWPVTGQGRSIVCCHGLSSSPLLPKTCFLPQLQRWTERLARGHQDSFEPGNGVQLASLPQYSSLETSKGGTLGQEEDSVTGQPRGWDGGKLRQESWRNEAWGGNMSREAWCRAGQWASHRDNQNSPSQLLLSVLMGTGSCPVQSLMLVPSLCGLLLGRSGVNCFRRRS
jgi:hypothetical protein